MSEYKFYNTKFIFWVLNGQVIEQRHFTSTDVRGRTQNDGKVYVDSKTTEMNEVWIRGTDGSEFSLTLANSNLPLRNGQDVSILCIKKENDQQGLYCGIKNKATGKWFQIKSGGDIATRYGLVKTGCLKSVWILIKMILLYIAALLVSYFAYLYITGKELGGDTISQISFAVVIAYAAFKFFRYAKVNNGKCSLLDDHIAGLMNSL